MAWIVKLVSIGAAGDERSTEVMRIARPDDLTDLATLGLTLAESKQLLAGVQQELVAAQARLHAARRPACRSCSTTCRVKDYRQHAIATLFGRVAVRLPRYCCVGCGVTGAGLGWPSHIRSTPELDRLRAQLAALMPYRTAAEVLGQVFPVDAGADPETLRRHTFKIAEALPAQVTMKPPPTGAEAIVVTLDFDLHSELRGRPAAPGGPDRQCRDGERRAAGLRRRGENRHGLADLIRRSLDAVGRTESTALTAFTDGCPGLRRILLDAGVAGLPILDWFHVAMRLQHLTQIAGGLSSDGPERAAAKAVIVEEVERLRWRLWNGKAKDAKVSIDRIRAVMHHFRDEPGGRRSIAASRKLWTALRALDGYLVGQSDRLVDYGERHRAGLRVGTALTEGTANFLVNRRMNKSQQMRWSRRGADRLLQVRCAVYNGTLGTGFGQRFYAANDALPKVAAAA